MVMIFCTILHCSYSIFAEAQLIEEPATIDFICYYFLVPLSLVWLCYVGPEGRRRGMERKRGVGQLFDGGEKVGLQNLTSVGFLCGGEAVGACIS